MTKRIIAKQTVLAYPGFNKPFEIHTDASHYQLGAVISQEGKPVAFYSRKLNDAQTRYTTTERELLSIVETLKAYRNILLGHKIKVYTDHKNLVYKHFNTERVMRWRLVLEEYGPELVYIKGENNIVADALSRLRLTEQDFSLEAFPLEHDEVPEEYPLRFEAIAAGQANWAQLQKKLQDDPENYKVTEYKHSDTTYNIITRGDKIVVDRGKEFAAEVQAAIQDEYGCRRKLITTRNPQANAVVERIHQVVHQMIRSQEIGGKEDYDALPFGWDGILAAIRRAVNSTVHTTTEATPTQLVYGRDALLNISFQANWEYIKQKKQKVILQNNKRENATRIPHQCSVGDRVMVKQQPNRKHGGPRHKGPYTITQVNDDNGTVKLQQAANNGGAVFQTWNIRNLDPCRD